MWNLRCRMADTLALDSGGPYFESRPHSHLLVTLIFVTLVFEIQLSIIKYKVQYSGYNGQCVCFSNIYSTPLRIGLISPPALYIGSICYKTIVALVTKITSETSNDLCLSQSVHSIAPASVIGYSWSNESEVQVICTSYTLSLALNGVVCK